MPVRRMAARIIPAGEGGYICCRYSAFACAAVWAAMYPNVSAGPILMQRYMGFTQNAKLKGQSFGAQRLVRAEALQPYGVRGQEQAPETQKAVSGTCGRLNRPCRPAMLPRGGAAMASVCDGWRSGAPRAPDTCPRLQCVGQFGHDRK